ncbi:MAG TPA: RNA ligase partner protein [Spirochaetota bacterium]|nr:RNA ligase partner protein [Spirochaetota bacterium]HPJ34708.1 RNA ligase partner protein [Spirochaetota bacterium]
MKIVIDTSTFVNPVTQNDFGDSLESAIDRFIKISVAKEIKVYTPTSIFRELSHFAPEGALKKLRKIAVIRGPDLYSMQFPAAIFHTFIADIRVRINKGLRIAEEAIESSKTADSIRRIRNEYRAAMRSGIIDSVEDLDVVLLAKEIGGTILSADEGILNMADSLGIEVFSSKDFIIKFDTGGANEERPS